MKFLLDNYANSQTIMETKVKPKHSGKLTTQSQQLNDQRQMRNESKVNNKDTRAQ